MSDPTVLDAREGRSARITGNRPPPPPEAAQGSRSSRRNSSSSGFGTSGRSLTRR